MNFKLLKNLKLLRSAFLFLFLFCSLLNVSYVNAQALGKLDSPCNENEGEYCADPLSCVNNKCINLESSTSGGTVGQYCDDGSNIKCISGLNCGTDNRCYDPNKSSDSGAGSGSGTNGGGTSTITCPEGLTAQNGLCLPKESAFPKTGLAGSTTLVELITKAIQFLLFFAGIIAVVFLVLGGYWYMASGGNDELAEKGKKTITNFVMGLVIIIMAYAIVTILFNTLTSNTFTK